MKTGVNGEEREGAIEEGNFISFGNN